MSSDRSATTLDSVTFWPVVENHCLPGPNINRIEIDPVQHVNSDFLMHHLCDFVLRLKTLNDRL